MATYILTAAQLNNRILNSFSIPSSGGSVDPDAQAFITAAGITDPTQQSAINTLVVGLKADNLWTSMQAIYPFVGGTASSHKYNLKDPRDLDAAKRLVFNGGWTHNADGITGNGVNTYAETFNNVPFSLGAYSRSANQFGVITGTRENYIEDEVSYSYQTILFGGNFTTNRSNTIGNAPYTKFYSCINSNSMAANQLKVYRNGINVLPTSQDFNTPWLPINTFTLGAIKNSNYFFIKFMYSNFILF